MKLLPLPALSAILCSREGWAIGEGLAWFYKWVTITIASVLAVALVSGIVVGVLKGKGAFWRQVGLHLLYGVIFLIVAPIIGWGIWEIREAQVRATVERNTALVDAWMAPLKNPPPGQLDQALAAVFDAENASQPGWRSYMIVALPELLGQIDFVLNDNERAAVIAAAQRLRLDNTRLAIGSHPQNLDRLDGAVTWLLDKPDLPAALQACIDRTSCTAAVLEFGGNWCKRRLDACRSAFTIERLDAAAALVKSDQSAAWTLGGIRNRIRGSISPP